jgi:hypothetical protein
MNNAFKYGTVALILVSSLTLRTQAQQLQNTTSCAQSEYRLFLPLVGEWEVHWITRTTPGKYESSKATSKIERDPVGCVLTEHFFGESHNQQITTVVLLNFGNAEKLERMLIDSGHRQLLAFTGTRNGDVIRFEWRRELGDRRIMTRHDYRNIQANSFLTEWYLSPDSGKTWELVQKAEYSRQP